MTNSSPRRTWMAIDFNTRWLCGQQWGAIPNNFASKLMFLSLHACMGRHGGTAFSFHFSAKKCHHNKVAVNISFQLGSIYTWISRFDKQAMTHLDSEPWNTCLSWVIGTKIACVMFCSFASCCCHRTFPEDVTRCTWKTFVLTQVLVE